MNLNLYPFARIVLPFSLGIFLAHEQLSIYPFLLLFLLAALFSESHQRKSALVLQTLLCGFIYCGMLCHQFNIPMLGHKHFSQHQLNSIQAFKGFVTDEPKIGSRSSKAILEVTAIKINSRWVSAKGCLLLMCKEKFPKKLQYGSTLFIYERPCPIPDARNPGEFSPKNHYQKKGILFQAFVHEKNMQITSKFEGHPLLAKSIQFRKKGINLLKKAGYRAGELALLTALVFGDDDHIEREISILFADTGVLHILSVSGLHIGIVILALQALLKLVLPSKSFDVLRGLLLVSAIWCYALLTGMSSPVVRACMMCTLFVAGGLMKRKGQAINLLCASALVMLCIKPMWLFDVGFQLSFLAITGIFLAQPWIEKFTEHPSRPVKLVMQTSIASLAATLLTLPVCLSEFHRFSWYFIPANLLAIPISTAIMYAIFLQLPLVMLGIPSAWMSMLITFLIQCMEKTLRIIAGLPYAVSENIGLSKPEIFLLVIALIMLLATLYGFNKKPLFAMLVLLLFHQAWLVYQDYCLQAQRFMIVFANSRNKHNGASFIEGRQAKFYFIREQNEEYKYQCIHNTCRVYAIKNYTTIELSDAKSLKISFGPSVKKEKELPGGVRPGILVRLGKFLPIMIHPSGVIQKPIKASFLRQAFILNLNNAKNHIVSQR
jgi:competence protein ComEC